MGHEIDYGAVLRAGYVDHYKGQVEINMAKERMFEQSRGR